MLKPLTVATRKVLRIPIAVKPVLYVNHNRDRMSSLISSKSVTKVYAYVQEAAMSLQINEQKKER